MLRRAGTRAAMVACALATLLAAGGLTACAAPDRPDPSGKVRVVAGFYPLRYVAEQVGGDRVRVTDLVQPGAEPHDVELSPRQMADIVDADLVVYLSGFQPAVDEAVRLEARDTSFDAATTVPLLDANEPLEPGAEEPATAANGKDPHVWLDPERLATITDALAGRLATADPAGAQQYRRGAAAFRGRLDQLDQDYAATLRTCQRRDIVVGHAAFAYLADRYGLRQIAITGLSPDIEPTPQRLAQAEDRARAHRATTIFFETLASPKVAQVIATEVGATTAVLDPIEGLAEDSAADYLSVMRANLATLAPALGCAG